MGNAPWRKGDRLGVRAGSRWPFTMPVAPGQRIPPYLPFPFYLAYAAAVLAKNGVEVLLVDAIAEGLDDEQFLSKIKSFQPHLTVLETSTPSIAYDLRMARRIKQEHGGLVTLSGPHVSALPGQVLQTSTFVDFVLVGEYEYTLLDLVRHLEAKSDPAQVPGLAYPAATGSVHANPRRPLIANLDELPWPARHFLPMRNYCDNFAGMPQPTLQMWASRGCPFGCVFCLWPSVMYGNHQYRVRNPVDVVDEIEWCIKEYGIASVYFDDDTFDIGKERILKLCQEIEKRALGVPWAAMARADTADREMLQAMAGAGLHAIKFGVESACPHVLERTGKRLDLKRAEESIKIAKELGIKVHLTFTFGLPGDDKDTIDRTIDYAVKLDPDSIQFSITTPFPGTPYYETLSQQGLLLTKSWSDFDGARSAVIRTPSLSQQDLERALARAEQTWGRHCQRKEIWHRKWHYLGGAVRNPAKVAAFLAQQVSPGPAMMPDHVRRARFIEKYVASHRGLFLDIGCNDCSVEEKLRNKQIEFIGVDLDMTALRRAQRCGHNVVRADARFLPFKPGVFDGCMSTEVLEHVTDYDAAISEMGRVLKPGAPAVVTVPYGQCERVVPFKKLVATMYSFSAQHIGHVRKGFTADELERDFGKHGFDLVECRYDLKLVGAVLTLGWYHLMAHASSAWAQACLPIYDRFLSSFSWLYGLDDRLNKEGFTLFAKFKKLA